MKETIKKKLLIWIPIILLVIAVGYIVFDKYTTAKEQEQISIFKKGAELGYQQAIMQIMQQASTCRAVPLYTENVTMNLVATECPAIQQCLEMLQQ